jgi:hypothetical protein
MSRKTRVDLKSELVEQRYATKVQMVIDAVSPKNLAIIGGRGTAKTTIFMARRSMDIIQDMPGAYLALVTDTYTNAEKNVVPTLVDGWKREGWIEGVHFVINKRPPAHFKDPYKPPLTFKNTISLYNGTIIILVSLDQPSSAAGNSYQHIFGDEARLLKFEKLKRLNPALRGEAERFGHSVYYRGRTFMTDMPNILSGDEDWIWDMKKEMDNEKVQLAFQAGMVLNEIKIEFLSAVEKKDKTEMLRLKKQFKNWYATWVSARFDLTMFYVVSTLANADILTDGYIADQLASLGPEEFKSAVLSLKPDIKQGEKFYGHLGEHHFYDDGILPAFYEKYSINDDVKASSLALRYIDHNAAIDVGVDFGDMCSMVTGQHIGNYLYLLKEFYTLAPESSAALAAKFRDFYKDHNKKVVNMYYDRSGNQYSKVNRDWASELKGFIEYDNGVSTGWYVNLISRNQATILQSEEYKFAEQLMGETHKGLPKLKIDKFGCECLKSSLELTKIIIKVDRKGSKSIHKDKSSEKLPLKKRPKFSTNFSDAFKYFIYRSEYTRYTTDRQSFRAFEISVF